MDQLKFEIPSKERELDAIEFINEFKEYNSNVEGVNGLHRYLDKYDEWLEKLEVERNNPITEKTVPMETYFVVRASDNKIVGMSNLRFALNDRFRLLGGNIGSCIRPTERGKGYSKIGLYVAFIVFKNHGVNEIMLDCDKNNTSSYKTILSMGGKLIKEERIDDLECIKQDYIINIDESMRNLSSIYQEYAICEDENQILK